MYMYIVWSNIYNCLALYMYSYVHCIYNVMYTCNVLYVIQAFKKFEILTRKRETEIMREEATKKVERMSQLPDDGSAPKDATEDELPISVPTTEEKEVSKEATKSAEATAAVGKTEKKKKSPQKVPEVPDSKKERTKAFNYTSDVFNGGDMDDYKWSQTITELEIKVALSEETTAKDVRVDIRNDYLKVEVLKPEHKVYMNTCTHTHTHTQ